MTSGFLMISVNYTIIVNLAGLFIKPLSESLNITRSQVGIQLAITGLIFVFLCPFMTKVIAKFSINLIMSFGTSLAAFSLIGM